MIRRTVADAKDPTQCRLAAVANVSPSDDRFLALLNLCTQNLVQTGEMFWGLHARYQFCVTDGCLVWPRQIATIEAAAVCDRPITIRNRWFEFLGTGVGLRGDGNCNSNSSCGSARGGGTDLLDRAAPTTCAFAEIVGVNKKIKVYADVTEAADAEILLQGYDENNQWIRTLVGGAWVDGEYVSISTTPVTSTKFFSALTGVQKPITNGTVRLYEYDTTLTTQRAIAIYEPDETRPSYRKQLLSDLGCGGCCGAEDDTTQVTVMAKLEFIPVRQDTDWLMIGNFAALTAEAQSVLKLENNLAQDSIVWHALAVKKLRDELSHYLGKGAVAPMRMMSRNLAGAAVKNMI